jgi:RNA polymerase sigma-70 factor, ECF subfamily
MTAVLVMDATLTHDYDEIFREHYGRLVRALTVVCGDGETAADAVQHAFMKAHVKWRKVASYDDPVGWIRRVAINKLRDEYRSGARKARAIERLTNATASVHTDEQDDDDDLAAALAELPKRQRVAVALFYVDQLSVNEIADALDLSEGAVKYHLHSGRNRLRDIYIRNSEGGRA